MELTFVPCYNTSEFCRESWANMWITRIALSELTYDVTKDVTRAKHTCKGAFTMNEDAGDIVTRGFYFLYVLRSQRCSSLHDIVINYAWYARTLFTNRLAVSRVDSVELPFKS